MKGKIASLTIAALVTLALFVLLIWKGIPMVLSGVVRLVPVSWEERLGRTVASGFTSAGRVCDDSELTENVREIEERLNGAMKRHPYRFTIKVVRNGEVNALAAPGGYIVLFSGLVDRMDTPEQLAGVLAHEMQHVVQRHSTQSMARAVGLQVFLSLLLGDPGFLGDLAGNLGILHFMRADERSADEGAIDTLMRAGIDPNAMIDGFRKLDRDENKAPLALKYLSTHPPIPERIAYLKERAGRWRGGARPFRRPLSRACGAER